MTFSSVLRAPQAGHINCRLHCTSTARRCRTSTCKEQTADGSFERRRACGNTAHWLSALPVGCRLGADARGACQAQRPHLCAASAGAGGSGACNTWDNPTFGTAGHRPVNRLAATSALQHSTDVRLASASSAATQPADTAFADGCDLRSSNGAGCSGEAAAERSTSSQCEREDGQGAADQHEQPPESGILTHAQFGQVLSDVQGHCSSRSIPTDAALSSERAGHTKAKALFLPDEKSQIRDSWRKIMRWSKVSCSGCKCCSAVTLLYGGKHRTTLDQWRGGVTLRLTPWTHRSATGKTCPSWRQRRKWSSSAAAALALLWVLRWHARKRTWM